MNKIISPIVFILFAGFFVWGIINDNSPKNDQELIMNMVVGFAFTLFGIWFGFFSKSVDEKNRKDHSRMYRWTGIKLFKKLAESVDKNPVDSFQGRMAGLCCGLIGLTLLIKSLITYLG